MEELYTDSPIHGRPAFKVDINSVFWVVWFDYDRNVGETLCRIYVLDDLGKRTTNEPISYGFAMLHFKDQFCKDTGRKVSLAKALQHINKKDRCKFWKEYFKMTNNEKVLQYL